MSQKKNIFIVCVALILLFIVSRVNATSGVVAFGLIALAQLVLTILFIVGSVRILGPSVRRLQIDAREPRKLIWGGAAVLVTSFVWLLVTAAFFSTNPSALGLTQGGGALVVILPTLFLAATGLSMIAYGFILRYMGSRPDL